MTAEIPPDKVLRTVRAIEGALDADWVGAIDLQSLLGLIGFCGQILVSGRWRVPWTVQAMRVAAVHGFAPMNSVWKEELLWWRSLLLEGNTVAMLMGPEFLIPAHAADVAPFTDACRGSRTGGAGGVFGARWYEFQFTAREIELLPICDLEGIASVLWLEEICERWPEEIAGRRFLAWCDNTTFIGCVNSHKTTIPSLAFLLGELHRLMAKFSFDLKLVYVKSKDNVAADALSRLDYDTFRTFMTSKGYDPAALVRVHIQDSRRDYWSSKMMSYRLLTTEVQKEQKRHSGVD